jgi:hypothetical protein
MESPKEIYRLIPLAMAAIAENGIAKDKEMGTGNFRYKYRGDEAILRIVTPVLARLGITFCCRILEYHTDCKEVVKSFTNNMGENKESRSLQYRTGLQLEVTWFAPDGSSIVTSAIGEAHDSGDKSFSKAMTQAKKYAIVNTLLPPFEGVTDDPDDTPSEEHRHAQPPYKTSSPQAQPDERSILRNGIDRLRQQLGMEPSEITARLGGRRTADIPIPELKKLLGDLTDLVNASAS